jgi:hypothetical protein
MPNVLHLTVENPEELLNNGAYGAGALIRVQSATSSAGVYADITGTGATPTIPIVSGTYAYTAYDPAGTIATWYRSRYENVGGTRTSDWSDVFQSTFEGSGLLASLEDVKQRLGLSPSDGTQDENILQFIAQVSASIMSYTGRRFARTPASGTTPFLFDVEGSYRRRTNTIYVPQGIAALDLVEIATQTGGAFTTVPSGDYFLDPPIQDRDFGWPATRITLSNLPTGGTHWFYPGRRVVRITMALGWPTIPADIAALAQRAVVSNFLAKGSGQAGQAIVGPTGAMTILRDIGPADMAMLTRYREPMVA